MSHAKQLKIWLIFSTQSYLHCVVIHPYRCRIPPHFCIHILQHYNAQFLEFSPVNISGAHQPQEIWQRYINFDGTKSHLSCFKETHFYHAHRTNLITHNSLKRVNPQTMQSLFRKLTTQQAHFIMIFLLYKLKKRNKKMNKSHIPNIIQISLLQWS